MSGPGFHFEIRPVTLTPRGQACGESHGNARHSNATVAKARELRAQGMRYSQIAQRLGIPYSTIRSWCIGRRRIVKLMKTVNRRVKVIHE